jgi:hypothetical protein
VSFTKDSRELMSKADYARRHGRRNSAVSNWISRQQLTAPALRADGRIHAQLADEQLGRRLDPLRSRPLVLISDDLVTAQQARAELIQSKASEAAIKAERARMALDARRGEYTLTEQMRLEYGRGIMEHLQSVEQSLPGLAQRLGLGRDGLLELRRWWRQQRAATAKRNRIEAANYPEFIEDPEDGAQ